MENTIYTDGGNLTMGAGIIQVSNSPRWIVLRCTERGLPNSRLIGFAPRATADRRLDVQGQARAVPCNV
jgi:hypothetical protein